MSDWIAIRRGGLLAAVPLACWVVVLGVHGLSALGTFVLAVVLSMPFLALAARVEADGDLSSRRRRGTLWVLVAVTAVEFGAWEAWSISAWLLAPVVSIAAWFAAGRSQPRP